MFAKLTQGMRDMATLKTLCETAERYALADHQAAPGAEHFVLASFDLPDGSAIRALERLGVTAAEFQTGLAAQYRAALSAAGVGTEQIDAAEHGVPPLPPGQGVYRAAPSGQALIQGLAALRRRGITGPLVGVHVLDVAVTMQHPITDRAFKALGRDPATVAAAVRAEMTLAA